MSAFGRGAADGFTRAVDVGPTPAFEGQRRLFHGAAVPPNGRDAAGWGVHRVMGTETEFGIHAPANPGAHHSVLSVELVNCLLYTSPSPRDKRQSRMPSSA